jgi:polyhydroxyalkanoate synthesis repressor PhaR
VQKIKSGPSPVGGLAQAKAPAGGARPAARKAATAKSAQAETVDAASLGDAQARPRIIKKYPNRRLYDTDTSTYITLSDVKALVMTSAPFVVRDAKTSEDLTRSILLQIILEEEAGGAPMFTEAVLANIIRFYGNALQGFMGSYLEKNVQSFMDLQLKMSEQSKGLTPELWAQFINSQSPMMQGMMGSYVEQSRSLFMQMQEQMQEQGKQMLSTFGLKR